MNLQPASIEEEDTQQGRYLTFLVDGGAYGLEIAAIKEIVGIQPITPLPETEGCVKGVINLRGRIIPVIDMHLKFGRPEAAYDDRTCIVVIEVAGAVAGLIVDTVSEVLTIEGENIVQPPSEKTGAFNRYIKGIGRVGNDVKLLLDINRLFMGNEPGATTEQ